MLAGSYCDGPFDPATSLVGGNGAVRIFLPGEAGGCGCVEIGGGVQGGGYRVRNERIGAVVVHLGTIAKSIAIGVSSFGVSAELEF